ncbi:Hypothetical predicted protein [Olea europaea subsp. europaea]|uniref:Uncharacterized protein n=1 Tax=Olea europaea subsp. europaea TaxID=158383 RepID=A0A8S0UCD3_OLEEU|nr:Hypothetical predicted protein [Olea europaea subsp. europaea]
MQTRHYEGVLLEAVSLDVFLKIISRIATELAEVRHLPCTLFHAAPHNHDLIRPLLHFLSFLNHKMLGNWRGPWVFIVGLAMPCCSSMATEQLHLVRRSSAVARISSGASAGGGAVVAAGSVRSAASGD